jgi:hypothetical protein
VTGIPTAIAKDNGKFLGYAEKLTIIFGLVDDIFLLLAQLDVSDGQIGAVETRGLIHAGGDNYLCPLSEAQLPPAVLAGHVARGGRRRKP